MNKHITYTDNPDGSTSWSCDCGKSGVASDDLAAIGDALAHYRIQPEPVVGMKATYGLGSDRYGMEVVSVSPSGKTIGLVFLDERTGKPVGPQDARIARLSRTTGRYRFSGSSSGIHLGHAEYYQDPSF